MSTLIVAALTPLLPLGVEVEFGVVPFIGKGGPILRHTITLDAGNGKKTSTTLESSSASTHLEMRSAVFLMVREFGWDATKTPGSALIVTGTERAPLKSLTIKGEGNTPSPKIRLVPAKK